MDPFDQNASEADAFEDLHAAIEDGEFETVIRIVENHGQEHHFSYDDTSALYKAFDCEKYDIISFLIHKGAKFVGSEHKYVYNFDIDLDRLNLLLLQYNKKSECSCVYRLMSTSQSPQVLDGDRLNALMSMYQSFFSTDIIKVLMKVLERVDFDIVFDFESDRVNRVHRLYNEEAEIYGLTLSHSNEIFVGAMNLLSGDPRKRAKVYGVVAEELCHLALTTVFQNNAKPYKEENHKLAQQFQSIVQAVKSFISRTCHIESVIQDVYEWYHAGSWECELIARVPHVVGIHGHESGSRIFQECSELSMLLKFYETNVLEKCRLYTDPSVNTKLHREMEQLLTKDLISFKEKRIEPLKEEFPSFRMYLVEWGSISVITTNCTRLCMLHVYHELKKEYDQLVEKKCLFFSRKCFEKNVNKIRDTLKGNLWEYLILVMDKSELNLSRFQEDYLEDLEEFIDDGMRLIMISSSQSVDHEFDFRKAVKYKWSDLSEEYKTAQEGIKYVFKGEEEVTYVTKEYFPKVFSDEDICMILSGEVIEVEDGNELFSQGYVPETYIEREFHTTVADEKIFQNLSPDTNIVLSGWNEGELRDSPFSKHLVQWLHGSEDEIQSDKSIFIIDKATRITVEDFTRNSSGKKNIWLHYDDRVFYVRNSNSSDVLSGHMKQKRYSEDEILKLLRRKRIVLICDNAGYGKSTVISNLIYKLKRNDSPSWNWRINFAKFAGDEKDSVSVANVEEEGDDEEVLDHFFLMLGLKNGFEKHLFWEYSRGGRCFIFFDGFDEIPSEYVSNALKLLSTVRKQTAVNMIISTRKHHQEELERLLDTYSHQLVPFSRKDQVRYLEMLWKSKLKHPCGKVAAIFVKEKRKVPGKIKEIIQESRRGKKELEQELKRLILALEEIDLSGSLDCLRSKIDDLGFTKLAEGLIDRTFLDKESLEFMGIPLHLFMIGVICYDSNFNAEIPRDIHGVYSKFVDQKVAIFVEEKQGWSCAGSLKERTLKNERKNAYRVHIELANKLMGERKTEKNLTQEDLDLCLSLGIVCIKGAQIDFLHFTFAEFFKAESVRMNMGSGSFVLGASAVVLGHPHWGSNPGQLSPEHPGDPLPHWNKYVFANVLFERKYDVVRRFLSCGLPRNGFENLTREFFQDIDFLVWVLVQFVRECSSSYYSFYNDRCKVGEVVIILKCLLETFEKTVDEDLLSAFVAKLVSGLRTVTELFCVGGCLPVKTLKVLLRRHFDAKYVFGAVESSGSG